MLLSLTTVGTGVASTFHSLPVPKAEIALQQLESAGATIAYAATSDGSLVCNVTLGPKWRGGLAEFQLLVEIDVAHIDIYDLTVKPEHVVVLKNVPGLKVLNVSFAKVSEAEMMQLKMLPCRVIDDILFNTRLIADEELKKMVEEATKNFVIPDEEAIDFGSSWRL